MYIELKTDYQGLFFFHADDSLYNGYLLHSSVLIFVKKIV